MAEKNTEKSAEKTETKTETTKSDSKPGARKAKSKDSANPAQRKSSTAWRAPLAYPYAVIQSGGKQYCVSKGDHILVEKLSLDPGAEYDAENVLLVASGPGKLDLGKPNLKGAKVKCEVLQQSLGPKILIRHARRRQSSQKTLGHRQPQTRLLIKEIVA